MEFAMLLTFGHHGTHTGLGEKSWDTGTTCPQPFRQSSLGVEF